MPITRLKAVFRSAIGLAEHVVVALEPLQHGARNTQRQIVLRSCRCHGHGCRVWLNKVKKQFRRGLSSNIRWIDEKLRMLRAGILESPYIYITTFYNPMKLTDLLNAGSDEDIAVSAPSRASLDFLGLRQLVANTTKAFNDAGIGRNDRVAIVLPNGPEMATCFLACACSATSAPLNPAYRVEEFEFYLDDLQACALIIEKGSNSPALAAAQKLGIRIIELSVPDGACAGQFTLAAGEPAHCNHGGPASASDVAMILHTSGTTSKPKRVPLTVENLCASAKHIAATLQFTPQDSGLNIMPLFHIHGLIAGLLAPLSAGSRIFCTPGFNALRFFKWM